MRLTEGSREPQRYKESNAVSSIGTCPPVTTIQFRRSKNIMASSHPQALSTVPAAYRVVATNEKVTGPAGKAMLRQSGIEDFTHDEALNILDNCCGGGIITSEVLGLPNITIQRIIAADNDDSMLSYTRDRAQQSGWQNVQVQHIDQTSIPLPDDTFDYIFSNFGVFFHPHDDKTLAETYRTLKPGGTAGFTSWKSIAWWPSVAVPALKSLLPDAPALPPTVSIFPAAGWTDTQSIPVKLGHAGFSDTQVVEYAFTPYAEAGEFAEATAVLVKVVMRRLWSESDFKAFESRIEGVIMQYLQDNFKDGKWDGQMVAIVTTGKK